MNGVSVILCCFNSVSRLYPTLKSLSGQIGTSGIAWEVILVDNNSNDNTGNKAKEIWNSFEVTIPFKVVTETTPGLSHARYRGIVEAEHSILIFCDDDNWLSAEYVHTAFRTMRSLTRAGAIGGWGKPFCEHDPPDWFVEFADNFATGPQGATDAIEDITDNKGYVYGAGAVFNKMALLELFGNDFKLSASDRVGNMLISGGDNELCYGLRLLGYKIYSDPNLKFEHFIPSSRMSIEYLLRLNFGFGYSYLMLLPYRNKLDHRPMRGLKVSWIWLLGVGLGQYVLNDLSEIVFKNGLQNLRFRVNHAGRRGWLWSIWNNRVRLAKSFSYINDRFK